MRVPIKIRMDGFDTKIDIDGVDVSDAVREMAFRVDPNSGPLLYLEMKVDPDIEVPAGVQFAAAVDTKEFLDAIDPEALRGVVDRGDFGTHPADLVLAEIKRRSAQ